MTILVTGATGNVGRNVVEQLVNRGADVRALVRDPSRAGFPASVAIVQGDLLDVDSRRSAMSGVLTLFLLNGVVADEYTQALIALNVAREAGIETDRLSRGGSGNLHSGDKWIVDLTAAMLAASRRQDEQATAPEPQPGVQGQGGTCCREGREDAGRAGATDPGSQFTSTAFTAILHREKIVISMDGKGCWRDNVFVERLWRSVKYGEVCLNAYASVPEARAGIGRYLAFCNVVRPHSALGGRTPDRTCFAQPLLAAA